MNPQQMKRSGIFLGIILMILTSWHIWTTFGTGKTNWYFLVMLCGMGLMLFYTIFSKPRRRKD